MRDGVIRLKQPRAPNNSCNHALFAQAIGGLTIVACLPQYLLTVLADVGRAPRLDLLLALQKDRVANGQSAFTLERNEDLVDEKLFIIRDILRRRDHIENNSVSGENSPPISAIFRQ